MTDQLRPGQRLIVYASLKKGIHERTPPDPFEMWLWNLSEEEFTKALQWRHE